MSDKELPKENDAVSSANEMETLEPTATPASESVEANIENQATETEETTEDSTAAVEPAAKTETSEAKESTEAEAKPEVSDEKEDTSDKDDADDASEDEEEVASSDKEYLEAAEAKPEVSDEKEDTSDKNDADDASEDEEEVASSDEEHQEEAEEAEDEIDYHALTKAQLIEALQGLIEKKPIQQIKNEVEEIKTEFNAKFDDELAQKKAEFLAEGGNVIDFHYSTPLKKQFNSAYFDYKEKRNLYYQSLKKDLQANYAKREELIEELKGLLNAEENINTTYKHFKDIQERWHTAGAIPRDKYNTVWNTYHHHVENFYDFLHLNREFRDLDFKHNLDQKLKIIIRAEELAQQSDVGKAFRELQMLHKMWKEEVGPVAKEHREEVWDKFSAATKIIHDKRQGYIQEQEKHFEVNHDLKKGIIEKINAVTEQAGQSHKAWQNAIKEVQKLRDEYFETGKVPRTKAKAIWNEFKESTRNFNRAKNGFYKNQKKEQYTNLEKKRALIVTAEENKDSDDFNATTPLMKKIQHEWKTIGHVPRKESDKIWKQFKNACNHYFDRVHAERNEANKEEMVNFEAKQKFLDALSTMEFTGKTEADLKTIKEKISEWKGLGRVPMNKRNIDRKFNKVLDGLFAKLNLDKQQAEMIRFENKVNSMASEEDKRKIQNEEFFISKRISETQAEIRQLENNLGFFIHAKSNNPLVLEVHKNIARHKEQLDVWKSKLSKIRALRKGQ